MVKRLWDTVKHRLEACVIHSVGGQTLRQAIVQKAWHDLESQAIPAFPEQEYQFVEQIFVTAVESCDDVVAGIGR